MATDPRQIELTAEQRQQLAEVADRTGRPWDAVLSEAISTYRTRNRADRSVSGRSFFDVLAEDGAIGVVKAGLPHDLSTNPEHLEGFGLDHEAGSD
jgi:hypothetical protein